MISAFYAAILAMVFVIISIYVIKGRIGSKMVLGTGNNDELLRRTRAHANFAEYTPLFLILLISIDHNDLPALVIHLLGIAFTLGRISHAYGMMVVEAANPHDLKTLKFRQLGMSTTFISLVSAAVILLVTLIPLIFDGSY